MKNKFKKIGLNRVLEIIGELLNENNTRSLSITSNLKSTVGFGKYDWVFLNENELVDFDSEFKELVLDNIKNLISEGWSDVVIKRDLDCIIIKCVSGYQYGSSSYETTIRCNNYITSTLVHQLVEKMYVENEENILKLSSSFIKTIQSIYTYPYSCCGDSIELSFCNKNNIFVKKINVLYDK
jgi:hypothetical protein